MRIAEQVTFGGSGLDRAAELRGDEVAQNALLANPGARVMVLWKLKPMMAGEDRLAWMRPDHPLLKDAGSERLFLGRDETGPLFAAELSGWEPAGVDAEAMGAFFDPTIQVHPAGAPDWHFAELRGVMARLSPRDAEVAAIARGLFGWHGSHGFCARCGAASKWDEAGWQRRCPDCGATHFPRTDPVVIMLITQGDSVLIGRSPGWPEGMYSLLAGFVEPGETIEAAVRREVAEEAGVPVGRVEYLASQPWVFPASLMIGCRGEALDRSLSVDRTELEDARWVGREEMLMVMAGEHPDLRPARRGAIAHFLISNWLADRLR